MWFLYLDESGDLGFDFFTRRPSTFFTVCILAVQGVEHNRRILSAVKKTIRRKLSRSVRPELKGAHTSLEVKKHFYKQVAGVPFDIYAMTLNKRRVYDELTRRKDRVYNFIARQVLEQAGDRRLQRLRRQAASRPAGPARAVGHVSPPLDGEPRLAGG